MTHHTSPRPGSRRAHVLSLAQQHRGTITPETFADMLGLTPGVTVGEQTMTHTSVAGTLADAQGRLWSFEYDQGENRILVGVCGGEMTVRDRVEWIEQISAEGVSNDDTLADEGAHFASTPEPFESSERVDLGEGHADVDVIEGRIEVTVRMGRSGFGACLAPDEARKIGEALVSAAQRLQNVEDEVRAARVDLQGVRTVEDLRNAANNADVPIGVLMRRVQSEHTTV